MAAIRAGFLNQGFGNFHGAGYYRNINYQNRFEDEKNESGSSNSDESYESSQDSRIEKNVTQNYVANALALEKHRVLMQKKENFIIKVENKLKYIDVAIITIGSLGVILAHAESELYYRNNNSPVENSVLYRSIVSLTTAILVALIIVQARFDYSILKEDREAAEDEIPKFFQNKTFFVLLLEIVICSIHCPPGLEMTFTSKQLGGTLTMSINEICASFMLTRVYLFAKVFRYFSRWTTHHSKEVCKSHGARGSPLFAVKAILKEKPFHLLIPLILLSVVVFSAAIRIFERSFVDSSSAGQDYSYIWNAMWMVMLTMTTVGYGDFFPKTHQGRFIAVLSCIWGIFLISLMVVTLTNFLLFTNEESRSFNYINRVKALEKSKKFAKLYIKSQLERFLYYKRSKKDPNFKSYVENLNLVIKYNFKKYKEAKQQAKFADTEIAEMLTVLNERISVQVNVIKKNLNYAIKVHENLTLALASQNNVKYCLESSISHIQELKRLIY